MRSTMILPDRGARIGIVAAVYAALATAGVLAVISIRRDGVSVVARTSVAAGVTINRRLKGDRLDRPDQPASPVTMHSMASPEMIVSKSAPASPADEDKRDGD